MKTLPAMAGHPATPNLTAGPFRSLELVHMGQFEVQALVRISNKQQAALTLSNTGLYVRLGQKQTCAVQNGVRFTPESGHMQCN
jgi:hypothetical protein